MKSKKSIIDLRTPNFGLLFLLFAEFSVGPGGFSVVALLFSSTRLKPNVNGKPKKVSSAPDIICHDSWSFSTFLVNQNKHSDETHMIKLIVIYLSQKYSKMGVLLTGI